MKTKNLFKTVLTALTLFTTIASAAQPAPVLARQQSNQPGQELAGQTAAADIRADLPFDLGQPLRRDDPPATPAPTATEPPVEGGAATAEPTAEEPTPAETPVATETPAPAEPTPTEPPVVTASPAPTETAAPGAEEDMQALAGVTWYVAPTGSDANNCASAATPCATINGAIGKASADDMILVASGTYTNTGTNVVFIDKSLTLSGGWNSDFTAQDGTSTINGEGARRGIWIYTGVITLERFVVTNGYTNTSGGGGIYNQGTLALNDSAIKENTTYRGGGGISNYGSLTLNNSSVTHNSAFGSISGGGGIYNYGPLTLNNSTVSGNSSYLSGGGIHNYGALTLNNSTVSMNITSTSGGGIYRVIGTVTLQNSILALNSETDCSGSIGSAGYNLIGNDSGCTFAATTGDQVNVNPNLGVLIGSPGYHPLLLGSPAIDAGNPATSGSGGSACLATDQRGVSRAGTCDIGAYEYVTPGAPSSITSFGGTPQRVAPLSQLATPLQALVLDAQGSPVNGVSVTFTAPGSGASVVFTGSGNNITTITSDAGGIVTAAFTANEIEGAYTVAATTSGVPNSADFLLENFSWYVSTTGNDANDCETELTPCATINAAIGKAANGDTIKIAIGTYTNASGTEVILVDKNVNLSGGWNSGFTTQDGFSTIDGGNARRGVTINSGKTVKMERFAIRNGSDSSSGGGIYNRGTLILNNSTVSGNSASSGGGIYNNNGTLALNNSTVSGNSASFGGGIYNNNGTFALNNSTVSGNHGRSYGGGIYNLNGTLTLNNSTVSGNRSVGIYKSSGTVILKNTILAGNSTEDCEGSISSAGYNLVGNAKYCAFSATIGDQVNVNPQLADLTGSLGYYRPLFGSPAINAGNPATPGSGGDACLATDQIGTTRPQGSACDIGAIEFFVGPPAAIVANSGTPQTVRMSAALDAPLVVAVKDQFGSPVQGVEVTFTAPASGASGTFADSGNNVTTATTDSNGLATAAAFTANGTTGSYAVEAAVAGIATPAEFQIENYAPIPTSVSISAGSPQVVVVNTAFSSLTVLVSDQNARPMQGIEVTFTAPASGASGTFADSGNNVTTANTDADGIATSSTFTANGINGSYVVGAKAASALGNFQLANAGPVYVSPSGADTGACNKPDLPCKTIIYAIGKAYAKSSVFLTTGTYTPVTVSKDLILSGGWNGGFTAQDGISTIDGRDAARGMVVNGGADGITVTLERFIIRNGYGGSNEYGGGGIYNYNGALTLINSQIIGNSTEKDGGGIYSWGPVSALTLVNSLVLSNSSSGPGGGISSHGSATLNNSVVSGNTSLNDGGGIYNYSGNLTLNNSAVSENISLKDGGGIYNHGGNITLNNPTISFNFANHTGGGIYANAGTVTLQNAILAANSAMNGAPDCSGAIGSGGYNLIGDNSGCAFTTAAGDLVGTGSSPINPRLLPLSNNGGNTLSHALASGSPALDAGNPASPGSGGNACLATDQRGETRPIGSACDIGAFEGESTAVTISGNAGIAGAILSYQSGMDSHMTMADGNGNYAIIVPPDWHGVVTPSKLGYAFTPNSRTYNAVTADQTAQDYAAVQSLEGMLEDPGFENSYGSSAYWQQYSTNFDTPLCTVADCGDGGGSAGPRTGTVWAWFGGTDENENGALAQTVFLPGKHPNLRLVFYLWIGNAQPGSDANDVFKVWVDDKVVFSANATQKSSYPKYTRVIADISAFADGGAHDISFTSTTTGQLVTFNLDDISLADGAGKVTAIAPIGAIGSNYSPAYSWSKDPWTTHYRLNLSGPKGQILDTWYEAAKICGDTTCSVTLGPEYALSGGSYTWSVQTYNSIEYGPWQTAQFNATLPSAPAAATNLSPGALSPAAPENIGINYQPTYRWSRVLGATYYRLLVSGPGGTVLDKWYKDLDVCDFNAATCSVSGPLLGGGSYSWYVQTYGPAGYGPWSNATKPMRFSTTATPPAAATNLLPGTLNPAAPENIGINYQPTFTWDKIPAATHYHLYLSGPGGKVLDKWYPVADICGDATCSMQSPLLGGGIYSWYVQTYGPAGYGAWSNNAAPARFSTTATPPVAATNLLPGTLNPAAPEDIGINYQPTFTWDKVPAATHYHLYLSGPGGKVLDKWYPVADICGDTTCSTQSPLLGGGTYSWYVQTYGPAGTGAWSNNAAPMRFSTAATPPAATTNLLPGTLDPAAPENIGINYQPTFTWDKVPAATYYHLYLSGPGGKVLADKWYPVADVCGDATCSTQSPLLGGGIYSWYVQTYGPAGYGPWSNATKPMRFSTTATPPAAVTNLLPGTLNPATPENIGINYQPTFTWDKIPAVTYYHLYLSGPGGKVLDKWYPVADICGDTTCSTQSPLLGGGIYSWYVQTYGPAGYGAWSNNAAPMRFSTTATPPAASTNLKPGTLNPAAPENIGINYQPTFTWDKVPAATYYHLYLSGPGGKVLDQWYPTAEVCGDTTCSTRSPLLGGGAYTWYVQTYGPAGYGPWSNNAAPARFSTTATPPAAPTNLKPGTLSPAAPEDIGVNYQPTFTWDKVPAATQYRLYLSGPGGKVLLDKWYPVADICGDASCSVESPLLGGGAYSWYVQTYGPAGIGAWSNNAAPMRFSANTLVVPVGATLTSPGGTIANHAPTYAWDKVNTAVWYRLYVKGPGGKILDQWYQSAAICDSTSCSVAGPMLDSGDYVWWVQSYNTAGYSVWRSRSFTVSP